MNIVTFEVPGEDRFEGSDNGGDRTDESAEDGKMGGLLAEEEAEPMGLVGLVTMLAGMAADALAVLRVSLLLLLHLSTSGSEMSWNKNSKQCYGIVQIWL